MTCGQVWRPILGICALHLTHPSARTHTHREHIPGAVGNHIAAAHGEQLGVRCLAQGSHLSRGIEGGESASIHSPHQQFLPEPETRTHNLWVTSPTLYPLGHDCPLNAALVSIRDLFPNLSSLSSIAAVTGQVSNHNLILFNFKLICLWLYGLY